MDKYDIANLKTGEELIFVSPISGFHFGIYVFNESCHKFLTKSSHFAKRSLKSIEEEKFPQYKYGCIVGGAYLYSFKKVIR
jgi:hypothetical protein